MSLDSDWSLDNWWWSFHYNRSLMNYVRLNWCVDDSLRDRFGMCVDYIIVVADCNRRWWVMMNRSSMDNWCGGNWSCLSVSIMVAVV